MIDTGLVDRAIEFAVSAHAGQERRGKGFPYIVHPLEAMSIVATLTTDQELLAAAVLHDVVEDTEYTVEDIRSRFGERISRIVEAESDSLLVSGPADDTWYARKSRAMEHLKLADTDVKIVAMGDKLSNMRAIARDHNAIGDQLWSRFHESDPAMHEWRYRGLADALSVLEGTDAYNEFIKLIDTVFGEIK